MPISPYFKMQAENRVSPKIIDIHYTYTPIFKQNTEIQFTMLFRQYITQLHMI
jgi:hypothetical protein